MEYNDDEVNHRRNGSLKTGVSDCKKRKRQTNQPLTTQPSRKPVLYDIILKKIQPSLSERKWIIDQRQRQVSMEKPKVHAIKERRDIPESGIKRSTKTNTGKDKEDRQRSKRKSKEVSERKRGLMETIKRKQNEIWYENSQKMAKRVNRTYDSEYKENHELDSVHSTDSEIFLAVLMLLE